MIFPCLLEREKLPENQKRKYKLALYQEIVDLRDFFHSSWFQELVDLDGPAIQQKIEEDVKAELRKKVMQTKKKNEKLQAVSEKKSLRRSGGED